MKPDIGTPRRILVRGVNWVGDTVLTYPAVQRLRRRFPQAHLAILVRRSLVDLWRTAPFIDEIIPFDAPRGWRAAGQDFRIALSLQKRRFDLAVILPRSFRSAFQAFLARIPVRLGYRDGTRSILLTHPVLRSRELLRMHRIHYYYRLVDLLGMDEPVKAPEIFLRDEDLTWAEKSLRDRGLREEDLLIGMNPGATYGLAKCWYPERFRELGSRIQQRQKAAILLFGKSEERAMTQRIFTGMGSPGADFTGETNLLQLAALLKRCRLLITNDTGTMHVAAAVGTPVVALFGPTDPVTTGPWGEGHVIVRKDMPCSPCLKRTCSRDHSCMKEISVAETEEAVIRRLEDSKR